MSGGVISKALHEKIWFQPGGPANQQPFPALDPPPPKDDFILILPPPEGRLDTAKAFSLSDVQKWALIQIANAWTRPHLMTDQVILFSAAQRITISFYFHCNRYHQEFRNENFNYDSAASWLELTKEANTQPPGWNWARPGVGPGAKKIGTARMPKQLPIVQKVDILTKNLPLPANSDPFCPFP